MRQNLLEITQHILSAMDSDEVNSVSDTVESYQIALLLKQVYYDLASEIRLPTHETMFQLEPSGDTSKPCLMTLPSNVLKLDWIRYNNYLPLTEGETSPNWKDLQKISYRDLIDRTQLQEVDIQLETISFDIDSFNFICLTNKMPQFYCDIGNNIVLFDSYLSTEDNTLQKSKTMCFGTVYPTFTISDSYIPDLDPTQFSYYINKAKARAFFELKQQQNVNAEREERRQKIITQVRKDRTESIPAIYKLPRYGR